MKAPERIWINYAAANKVDLAYDEPPITPFDDVSREYVRADLAQSPDAGVVAELVEAAEHVLRDIDDLVASSEGVAGLHMNGDIADWQSLLDGGSFGSWLSSLERLRAALAIIAHNTTETRA